MKITQREDRNLQLEEVYNPIVIKTQEGAEFYIAQRDGGLEITQGKRTTYIIPEKEMTPERARTIIGNYLRYRSQYVKEPLLPDHDAVLERFKKGDLIHEWTFRGLLKIAYDLH